MKTPGERDNGRCHESLFRPNPSAPCHSAVPRRALARGGMRWTARAVPSEDSTMQRLKDIATTVRDGMPRPRPRALFAAIALAAMAIALYQHPPLRTVARGEVA